MCPAIRNVNLVNAASSLLADLATQTATCKVDLLILSGGDLGFASDTAVVKGLFAGDTTVNTSAFFFVNNTPGLSVLRQYDVVLLFANGLLNQSAALGSEIASYVQLGGNVITATFYWPNRTDSGLGSVGCGTLEALDAFTTGAGQTYQAASLNATATGDVLTLWRNAVRWAGAAGGPIP